MDGQNDERVRLLRNANRRQSTFGTYEPHPDRPLRYLINSRRATLGNTNAGFDAHLEAIKDAQPIGPSPTTYGYLEHLQSLKPLMKADDKSLPKKVRQYYANQQELITQIEDFLLPKSEETKGHQTDYQKKQKRKVDILTYLTLITNIILVVLKIIAAIVSQSLSVISSVVDSVVDLLTSAILIWTARQIKQRDIYKYPGGRTRLEPIAVVVLSVIMCSASVVVVFESSGTLAQDVEYFENQHNASSTLTLPYIDMSVLPIVAMVLTIVSKAILFLLCYRIKTPTMYALAEDNRNDVVSNIVALVCGLVASNALNGNINQKAIVVDPVGAILIALYIIIAWILQANKQVRNLTGVAAEPTYIQQLSHIVYNYRPDVVTKVDSILAIHFGTNLFVEVDIGLPGSMPLSEAHDIGIGLQNLLETLEYVERAFVHLDFEFDHMPAVEHKTL